MQNYLKAEQIVLTLKVAFSGAPEVVPLVRKIGAQPFSPALLLQPADVTGGRYGTLPLFFLS